MGMTATLVMWPNPFDQAFLFLSQEGSTWNLVSIGLVVIEEKTLKNIDSEKFGQSMTLSVGTHKASCTYLVDCIYKLLYHIDYNSLWKRHCFNFFPYKSIGDQIWPCHKIGQGQPMVIIWTSLVVLKYPMLHTNLQVIGLLVPEKKNFSCFTIYGQGIAVSLVMWPGPFEQTFVSYLI